jgi:pyridoxine 5-phosphate synthase
VIIVQAAKQAHERGLQVNAGHGLHYHNTQKIAAIPELVELNIGHAIVARSVFTGFQAAVREMKQLMQDARRR